MKCGAKTRAGTPCQKPAGSGTVHVGTGRCKLHGGCAGGPITTGKNAKVTSRQLRERVAVHLANPNPLDLRPELALLRSLLDFFNDKLEKDKLDPKISDATTFLLLVQGIQKVADTISKIQSRELLTTAEMMLTIAVLADVLREEVTDERTLTRIFGKFKRRLSVSGQTGREVIPAE